MSGLLLAVQDWPDGIDATVTVTYVTIALGVPMLGYVFMVLDFRAYLRSLRRRRSYLGCLAAIGRTRADWLLPLRLGHWPSSWSAP